MQPFAPMRIAPNETMRAVFFIECIPLKFILGGQCLRLGTAAKVGRFSQAAFELRTALAGFVGRIELFGEAEEAGLQFIHAHVLWLIVDIEEGAEFPCAVTEDAAFVFQACVKRRAGKGSHEGDLHFVKAALADEVEHFVKDFGGIAIEAEDEAAIHSDAVGLILAMASL